MSELGTRLREARVNKGYTLNTLQQMTKIQKKYLQALEEGNYDEIPGTFYIRAFVKQYGDMVGLDGDQLLVEYADELEVQNESSMDYENSKDEEPLPSRLATRHSGEESSVETFISYIPLIILTGIILLIILILFMAINELSQSDEPAPQETVQQTQSVVESVEPSSVMPESDEADETDVAETTEEETPALAENQIQVGNQLVTLVSEPGTEAVYQLEGPLSNYEFGLEASNFVWLGIYEDGNLTVDQTVLQDESYEYSDVAPDTQEIRLEMGYPEGGVFTINGEEVEVDPAVPYTILILVNPEASEGRQELTLPTDNQTAEPVEETVETEFQGPAVYAPE